MNADDFPSLPPGQRAAALQRFGLPTFAKVMPAPSGRPVVTVTGNVRRPRQFDVAELVAGAPVHDMTADLHCVTGWSARNLTWTGVRLADVLERLEEWVQPDPRARFITFVGLDAYRSCVAVEDVMGSQAMLATALDGVPLTMSNGAPLRLVIPSLYGYRSVRSVAWIQFRQDYDSGSAGLLSHRRARVAYEERSPALPGWLWRHVWRLLVDRVRRRYRAAEREVRDDALTPLPEPPTDQRCRPSPGR